MTNPKHHEWWGLTADAMRAAHRREVISPTDDLDKTISALPYSADEIDDAFDAFVDEHGRTAGATVLLNDLTPDWRQALEDRLLVVATDRDVIFTERGFDLFSLLQQYGRSDRVWKSSVYSDGDV